MQAEIISQSHLAIAYLKENIEKWQPNLNLKPIVEVMKTCERYAMENIAQCMFIEQLDAECKTMGAIEECITAHLKQSEFEDYAWRTDIAIKSKNLNLLAKELRI